MENIQETILHLAGEYKENPAKFIRMLERLSERILNQKGTFFLNSGSLLYESSYIDLALNTLEHALNYLLRNNDRDGQAMCYGNLGIANWKLGNFSKALN
jgi:hypothetical protein